MFAPRLDPLPGKKPTTKTCNYKRRGNNGSNLNINHGLDNIVSRLNFLILIIVLFLYYKVSLLL